MPRRRKKSDSSEKFRKHGYWNHPDPALTIRQLLARDARLLASFNEAYEEEDGEPGLIQRWMEREAPPAAVAHAIRAAYAELDSWGFESRFDGVLVASGSGPDMGGMSTWNCSLLAWRRDGWIHYRAVEDGDAPNPTRLPLTAEEAYSVVAGDPYSVIDNAPDYVASCIENPAPTRADIERALEHTDWISRASSDFYDFAEIEKDIHDGVLCALLERFALEDA